MACVTGGSPAICRIRISVKLELGATVRNQTQCPGWGVGILLAGTLWGTFCCIAWLQMRICLSDILGKMLQMTMKVDIEGLDSMGCCDHLSSKLVDKRPLFLSPPVPFK